jgi:Protein of unknown function (DUF3006)
MPDTHRWVVDRYERDLAVVQVDGRGFVDVPRWLLPRDARPDDVLAVTVDTEADRATIAIVRDAAATARGRDAARAALDRLRRRHPDDMVP